jgi:hypothetical protein
MTAPHPGLAELADKVRAGYVDYLHGGLPHDDVDSQGAAHLP